MYNLWKKPSSTTPFTQQSILRNFDHNRKGTKFYTFYLSDKAFSKGGITFAEFDRETEIGNISESVWQLFCAKRFVSQNKTVTKKDTNAFDEPPMADFIFEKTQLGYFLFFYENSTPAKKKNDPDDNDSDEDGEQEDQSEEEKAANAILAGAVPDEAIEVKAGEEEGVPRNKKKKKKERKMEEFCLTEFVSAFKQDSRMEGKAFGNLRFHKKRDDKVETCWEPFQKFLSRERLVSFVSRYLGRVANSVPDLDQVFTMENALGFHERVEGCRDIYEHERRNNFIPLPVNLENCHSFPLFVNCHPSKHSKLLLPKVGIPLYMKGVDGVEDGLKFSFDDYMLKTAAIMQKYRRYSDEEGKEEYFRVRQECIENKEQKVLRHLDNGDTWKSIIGNERKLLKESPTMCLPYVDCPLDVSYCDPFASMIRHVTNYLETSGVAVNHKQYLQCMIAAGMSTNYTRGDSVNVIVTGPAGTGKSHMIRMCASFYVLDPKVYAYETAKVKTSKVGRPVDAASLVVKDEIDFEKLGLKATRIQKEDLHRSITNPDVDAFSSANKSMMTCMRPTLAHAVSNNEGEITVKETVMVQYGTELCGSNASEHILSESMRNRFLIVRYTQHVREDKDLVNSIHHSEAKSEKAKSPVDQEFFAWTLRKHYLLLLVEMYIGAKIFPNVSMIAASKFHEAVTTKIQRFCIQDARDVRDCRRFMEMVRTLTLWRAIWITFNLGIGGPKPTEEFDDSHLQALLPFFVAPSCVFAFAFEVSELYIRELRLKILEVFRNFDASVAIYLQYLKDKQENGNSEFTMNNIVMVNTGKCYEFKSMTNEEYAIHARKLNLNKRKRGKNDVQVHESIIKITPETLQKAKDTQKNFAKTIPRQEYTRIPNIVVSVASNREGGTSSWPIHKAETQTKILSALSRVIMSRMDTGVQELHVFTELCSILNMKCKGKRYIPAEKANLPPIPPAGPNFNGVPRDNQEQEYVAERSLNGDFIEAPLPGIILTNCDLYVFTKLLIGSGDSADPVGSLLREVDQEPHEPKLRGVGKFDKKVGFKFEMTEAREAEPVPQKIKNPHLVLPSDLQMASMTKESRRIITEESQQGQFTVYDESTFPIELNNFIHKEIPPNSPYHGRNYSNPDVLRKLVRLNSLAKDAIAKYIVKSTDGNDFSVEEKAAKRTIQEMYVAYKREGALTYAMDKDVLKWFTDSMKCPGIYSEDWAETVSWVVNSTASVVDEAGINVARESPRVRPRARVEFSLEDSEDEAENKEEEKEFANEAAEIRRMENEFFPDQEDLEFESINLQSDSIMPPSRQVSADNHVVVEEEEFDAFSALYKEAVQPSPVKRSRIERQPIINENTTFGSDQNCRSSFNCANLDDDDDL